MTARSTGVAIAALAGMVAPVITAAPAGAATPPTAAPQAATSGLPATPTATYRVMPGDTLTSIAAKFKVNLHELARINNLTNPNRIYPGQVLQIRAPRTTAGKAPAAPKSSAPVGKPAASYTVKAGDTLSGIAAKLNTSVAQLQQANRLTNPNRIYPGQVLQIRAPR
ncbi:MAG: LysM peptidoglycan-binding domain-containing protein, partial [Bowdeniella nasicola]|nr:LysM peptidoglycan-binding domain-containing protein [Bowdeniella nasicola]